MRKPLPYSLQLLLPEPKTQNRWCFLHVALVRYGVLLDMCVRVYIQKIHVYTTYDIDIEL